MADLEKSPEQLQQEMFEAAMTAEVPATPEPAPEPKADSPPPAPPAPEPTPPPATEGQEAIPSWRLREEAEARRAAETRAQALERRLIELETHARQAREGEKKPDFFENPDIAVRTMLQQALEPIAREFRDGQMYNSRMVANNIHGADKVAEAERAFLEARDNQTLDPVDYERVVQSPNRWDAAVAWHRQQSVRATVGDDPEAYFNARLSERLKDPAFRAELVKQMQGGSGRVPTEVRLPPSLSKATSVADATEGAEPERTGDMSDASLFDYAFRRGRRSG